MKKLLFFAMIAVFVHPGLDAQNFLTASKDHITTIPFQGLYDAMDINDDTMYALGGDTIYYINLETGLADRKERITPSAYSGFVSFITYDQDTKDIWVGYTVTGFTDDRIYKYDNQQQSWSHIATFPANFDLAIRDGKAYISGTNSTSYSDPAGIWSLDLSGANDHRMIIKTGGYASGLDVDSNGNIYTATNLLSGNALLKWTTNQISSILETINDTLKIADAEVLTEIPAGSYDMDLDTMNNIAFTCNNFVENFVGLWDGDAGYDTLATSTEFLSHIATLGDLAADTPYNKTFVMAYGKDISEVHYELWISIVSQITAKEFTVFPNPVLDQFHIDADIRGNASLNLTDMTGRCVLKREYSNSNEAVDISFLVPGNYVLTFLNNGCTQKSIIQKK